MNLYQPLLAFCIREPTSRQPCLKSMVHAMPDQKGCFAWFGLKDTTLKLLSSGNFFWGNVCSYCNSYWYSSNTCINSTVIAQIIPCCGEKSSFSVIFFSSKPCRSFRSMDCAQRSWVRGSRTVLGLHSGKSVFGSLTITRRIYLCAAESWQSHSFQVVL